MTERVIRTRIRTYFATEAEATSENRVLKEGEIYTEKNATTGLSTGRRKVGTGTSAWVDLPYEPSSGGGGGGSTDLSIANRGATTLDVASSTGNDATLPAATNALAGVATAAQIAKLEGIAAGATANATDAQLRDRSTHTGTQAWSTITGTPTTLSGYGITDAQAYDADLAAIAALAGTSGLLRKTAADTWSLDTSVYLTANQSITVSGDASGSGATSITLTLASVGTAGTYRSVTVDAKGRVTGGTTPTTFAGYAISDTSANLAAAISDETGSGSLVFANSPTLVTPALGTPSSVTLTNGTGLPIGSGVSGLGTGIATALAVAVGNAGAPVLFNGALGTPASGTLTNATGLPPGGITMATARLLGRSTAGSGVAEEISIGSGLSLSGGTLSATGGGGATNLSYTAATRVLASDTGTDATLPLFTSSDAGLAPASGGGTSNFLRADGTWAAPPGGGGTDQPLYFDAAEFIPRTTNGCGVDSQETSTNRVNRDLLAFDPAAIEYAQKVLAWPVGWNTATATFFWKASSGTGSCVWLARMRIFADGDAEDQAFGTAQSVTDAAASANTHRQTAATSAITPGGTVANSSQCILEVYRDPTNGSDDLAVDALLIGVLLTKAS